MAVSPSRISLPDRYTPGDHVATGGMASVWRAHDDLLHRDVAVKILAPHLAEDERARKRFMREARTAAGLSNHPHVVTIYDVGEHDGVSFIVMELMTGGTVADRIKAGSVERSTALRWLGEAAGALDAAHEREIVHRDVKPANLLLDERDRSAIADFGIARVALEDQLTATGIVLGTASYIAPEQAEGKDSSAASDRYALAVVAFELLTGTKPFQAEHFAAQARMHVEDPPPRASDRADLPRAVDAVLLRGMAKAPDERWESATQMIEALGDALDGEKTRPTAPLAAGAPPRRTAPAPARTQGSAPGRNSRAAWLALAGLAVAAIALALVLSSGGGGGGDPAPTATPEPTEEAQRDKPAEEATPEPTPEATAEPEAQQGSLSDAREQQLAGYAANNEGDYESGLAASQRALEICGDQQALDPCGYALYETGRALVELGRGEEAVPFLEQRLDVYGDNGSGDVQEMLDRARGGDASASSNGNGNGNAPGKAKKPKKDDDD